MKHPGLARDRQGRGGVVSLLKAASHRGCPFCSLPYRLRSWLAEAPWPAEILLTRISMPLRLPRLAIFCKKALTARQEDVLARPDLVPETVTLVASTRHRSEISKVAAPPILDNKRPSSKSLFTP